jgi:hypothetical protein
MEELKKIEQWVEDNVTPTGYISDVVMYLAKVVIAQQEQIELLRAKGDTRKQLEEIVIQESAKFGRFFN